MQQFNLDKWLQDKSRKVVTKTGEEVKIIDTNAPDENNPIIGYIYHKQKWNGPWSWHIDGVYKVGGDDMDLFFADEEEELELTEFEDGLFSLVSEFWQKHSLLNEEVDIAELVKENSKTLLDLARKELEPELDKKLKESYNQGGLDTQEEITKCLPKWKKITKREQNYLVYGYLSNDEYYLSIKELIENLPKEK